MILYIAEKPSLGRAIAAVLPKPHKQGEGFIQVGNGDYVSWCIGHLLEQAEPDAYDPAFKQWQLQHLPILPEPWQLAPKAKTRKQLGVLRKLVKQADLLVHAGDPDREGQLLVDEVIEYLQASQEQRHGAKRCLISDLNPAAVQRALERLRDNREFIPLSVSALARSRADWLYGINLTRAYTLQGRKVGYQGVLSVGRVQTPVLGLVVRRDREIEQFVSKPFFEVWAEVETPGGERFKAKWQPSEACRPYQDEEGRVLSKALAANVVSRIGGKPATVAKVEKQLKRQAPPLPYNLSSLQIDAAKRYGLSAQQVLDTCQALYERHKLITYPRSDSRHLPVEQHAQAPAVVQAIAGTCPALQSAIDGAELQRKSKAWNDAKVDAHHAIIPTLKRSDPAQLSRQEQQLYQLIARQYLCQFYGPHEYFETVIELQIEGGRFLARARQVHDPGWKALFARERQSGGGGGDALAEGAAGRAPRDDQEEPLAILPPLVEGQALQCLAGELREKQTQPPKHFTDATLLAAMTGIARFVEDPQIRKILKETDGLGTEATRAGIIELLFKRGFLQRQAKQIRSTEAGRGLIDSLPPAATTPDMTARWEATLDAISQRQASYDSFMRPMIESLQALVESAKQALPTGLQGVQAAVPSKRRRSSGRRGVKKTGAATKRKPASAGPKISKGSNGSKAKK